MLGLLYRREAWGPEEVGREPSVSTPAHYLEYEESNAPCPWGRVRHVAGGCPIGQTALDTPTVADPC